MAAEAGAEEVLSHYAGWTVEDVPVPDLVATAPDDADAITAIARQYHATVDRSG